MRHYPPLDLRVATPRVELAAATDDLLDQLAPAVRDGKAMAEPAPYDDPISLYEVDPDKRVAQWWRGIWRGRGRVDAEFWRLYFVVLVEGAAVGMQDLVGERFGDFGTVSTFSWLSTDVRGQGLGRETRQAILQLAFDGFDAKEAASDAFTDNAGSNAISRALGYHVNGTTWDTRRGEPAQLRCWRLTKEAWQPHRRADITLHNVEATKATLDLR